MIPHKQTGSWVPQVALPLALAAFVMRGAPDAHCSPWPGARTVVVRDVQMVIDNTEETELTPESLISYRFYALTQEEHVLYVPRKLEYLCQATMLDSSGRAVPRTAQGETAGRKFRDVQESYLARRGIFDRMGAFWFVAIREPGRTPSAIWLRPQDLFLISKPGRYTMHLTFQVFVLEKPGGTNSFRLVRFPEIQCPVIKK
jgi:hypothetical protein